MTDKPIEGRKGVNLSLLTQLLQTMMGEIAAQPNVASASRAIAAQMALMLKVKTVFLFGWGERTDRLFLWGSYRQSKRTATDSLPSGILVTSELAEVLKQDQPVRGSRAAWTAAGLEAIARLPAKASVLFIPLRLSDEPFGLVVVVNSDSDKKFTKAEMTIGQIFANHASVVLDNIYLQENAERRSAEIEGLRKASLELSSTLDEEQVISIALENIYRLLPDVRQANLYLSKGEDIELAKKRVDPGFAKQKFSDPRPDNWANEVLISGESLYLGNDPSLAAQEHVPGHWDTAIISMALRVGERVLGVLEATYGPPLHLDDELRLMRLLADLTASALENARLHADVQLAAMTDALTGIPNRRAFEKRLDEEIRRAQRYQRTFSLLMIDLDHFKSINDQYGHKVGDVALQDFSRCIHFKVRDTDFLARLGGDEFVLILPETQRQDAKRLGEKLKISLGKCTIGWGGGQNELSFSLGIAQYPGDGENGSELLAAADRAMYVEKQNSAS